MKSLATTLPLTLALGGLVAGVALLLPLEAESRTSSLIGALLASLVGGLVMVIKSQLAGVGLAGMEAIKALMMALGLSFLFRLTAVGVGVIIIKQVDTLSPFVFVIGFLVVSLGQQLLETRTLLAAARNPVKSSEVTP